MTTTRTRRRAQLAAVATASVALVGAAEDEVAREQHFLRGDPDDRVAGGMAGDGAAGGVYGVVALALLVYAELPPVLYARTR